jgi:long-subunit acyl-CoA synthetase (AMP-forming)
MLTPSMKLRRRIVEDHYRSRVDAIYAQADSEPVAQE